MRKLEKLLILVPNTKWFNKRYFQLSAYTPCLLAAILKNIIDVEILDANVDDLSFEGVQERIKQHIPDIVGISGLTMEYGKNAHKLAQLTKEVSKDIITVIGGIYPTLLPQIAMNDNNIDYVVLGEGENRLPELIKKLRTEQSLDGLDGFAYRVKDKVKILPVVNYIQNLDEVPFPDYSKVDVSRYFNHVNKGSVVNLPQYFPYADTITSRGCAFKCVFCSSQAINGPKIRYRSAKNVLEEIDILVNMYGIRHITFNDDNFNLDKRRVKDILNGLIEREYGISWKTVNAAVYALDNEILELMKKSGAYQIFLAIESGNQDVLTNIIKKPLDLKKVRGIVDKCKRVGLQTGGMFIIGLPGETWDQIRQTLEYAYQLDLDYTMINIATPLPCTELYDIAHEKGYLEQEADLSNLEFSGFGKGVISTEEFEPFELQVLRAFEWDRLNFSSEKKKNTVAQMLGISTGELEILRKETRRKLGI